MTSAKCIRSKLGSRHDTRLFGCLSPAPSFPSFLSYNLPFPYPPQPLKSIASLPHSPSKPSSSSSSTPHFGFVSSTPVYFSFFFTFFHSLLKSSSPLPSLVNLLISTSFSVHSYRLSSTTTLLPLFLIQGTSPSPPPCSFLTLPSSPYLPIHHLSLISLLHHLSPTFSPCLSSLTSFSSPLTLLPCSHLSLFHMFSPCLPTLSPTIPAS